MMASSILESKTGGNTCIDIGVSLNMDCVEDEDDVKAAPKEFLDLVDRHERKSQTNIELPLEVNLG